MTTASAGTAIGAVLAKGKSGASGKQIVVTDEMIREAMKDSPLKTQQRAVSIPAIQRYVERLLRGEIPPPIKVDGGAVVDGNHRYIAGRILGIEPEQIQWKGLRPDEVIEWSEIILDSFGWGNN